MRILVADDHSLFRDGLTSLLTAAGHEIVGEAEDGHRAVQKALNLRPDLVLMDIHMPGLNGLEALKEIRNQDPSIKIVMLTVSDKNEDLMDAIEAGASGYLLKILDSQTFIAKLKGLETGQAAITGEMVTQLMGHLSQRSKQPPKGTDKPTPSLTERELELLPLIAKGLSNREIAKKMFISENTVKYHIKNLLQKLSLKNRAEAAAFAIQQGLVED